MESNNWLIWVQRLQALAQSGLAYTQNPYEIERYEAIRDVAGEMLSSLCNGGQPEIIQKLMAAETGYATPKLDVRGVVFQGDKILLTRELADGGWTLPGGWVDVNDRPGSAVEREVLEETGYEVKAVKLLALYDRNLHGHPAYIFHLYKLFFLCEFIGGEAVDSIETAGAQFFAEDEIPPLSVSRTTPEVLARMFAHHCHPEWPTDFD